MEMKRLGVQHLCDKLTCPTELPFTTRFSRWLVGADSMERRRDHDRRISGSPR